MGAGSWSSFAYDTHASVLRSTGKSTFNYSDDIKAGKAETKVHELLDPLTKAGPTSPFAGRVMREVTISDEHPNPTPIAIILDVTGSNIGAARAVHAKLPQLFGLLQRKGLVEDPQILIGAIGDANSDAVPLQIGQFESDNRIDAMVEAMYLEGNGGGQRSETYEVAAYYLARHTHLEPWHKQGRKGYAIFLGDENFYPKVKKVFDEGWYSKGHTLESLTGDTIEVDIESEAVWEELKEQYEPFFLFQKQGSYRETEILPQWRRVLGEQAMVLDDPNTVCEFIAGLLAMREGGLDLDEMAEELADAGFDKAAILSTSRTLATVGAGGSGGAVAKTDGSLGLDDSTGSDRL